MGIKQRLRHSAACRFHDPTGPAGSAAGWVMGRLVRQFHHPTGAAGHATGWFMGRRSSNVRRNRWAVDLLAVEPTNRVLELGCGPGVAIAAPASQATRGLVVSRVMIEQARRRNAAPVREGRVRLIHAPVECLQATDGPFDAALAVNNVGMWPEPTARLRGHRSPAAARRADRCGLTAPLPGRLRSDIGGGRRHIGRPPLRPRLRGPSL